MLTGAHLPCTQIEGVRIPYGPLRTKGKQLNDLERGWIAGLLEGEATFLINHGSARIICEMTDFDVIKRLHDLCGGTVSYPKYRAKEHYKKTAKWQISGPKAADLMVSILPLMFSRRSAKIEGILDSVGLENQRKRDAKEEKEKFIKDIAEKYLRGEGTYRSLAEQYSVSKNTIYRKVKELSS